MDPVSIRQYLVLTSLEKIHSPKLKNKSWELCIKMNSSSSALRVLLLHDSSVQSYQTIKKIAIPNKTNSHTSSRDNPFHKELQMDGEHKL
jgi:hypothetical protein